MNGITVRAIEKKDLDAGVLMGEMFFLASGYDGLTEFDQDTTRGVLASFINAPDKTILVAELDGFVVGAVGLITYQLWFNAKDSAAQELFWWVHPESRPSGAGTLLLDAAETWSKYVGAKILFMGTLEASNPERIGAMYTRRGYKPFEHLYAKKMEAA